MVKKWQEVLKNSVRVLFAGIVVAVAVTLFSGCAGEAKNPFGTESINGKAPKEEAFAVQFDCSGIYNGTPLPKNKTIGNIYPLRFSGKWKQIPDAAHSGWYMAMTSDVGARVDLCATMTRCVFDFWDYEFYDNPGKIKVMLDDKVLGTYDLARTDGSGKKILDYVVATQKNTVATASIVLLSGRMVLTGAQANVFNKHWPY